MYTIFSKNLDTIIKRADKKGIHSLSKKTSKIISRSYFRSRNYWCSRSFYISNFMDSKNYPSSELYYFF